MQQTQPDWRPLYRIAALCATLTVLTIPAQVVVYSISQPPEAILDWFALYNANPALGLLNLDLIYAAAQVLMVPFLLAVTVSLWGYRPALALAGAAVMLFAITIHTTSNPSVEMLSAARAYAAADTDAQRAIIQAAGETLLYRWTGTSYAVGYILGGVGVLILSAAMWGGQAYGRFASVSGLVLGVMWLVPASFGTLGLAMSFLSLLPTVFWLSAVGLRLWRLSQRSASVSVSADSQP